MFFHEVFGHRIEGHRQKDTDERPDLRDATSARTSRRSGSAVYDDPQIVTLNGIQLNGFYRFDDEGVRAHRVAADRQGQARRLRDGPQPDHRASRTRTATAGARRACRRSRARATSSSRPRRASTRADLEKMLIEEVKKQHRPYGMIFTDISGGFTNTSAFAPQAFKVNPVMAYRLYPDGKKRARARHRHQRHAAGRAAVDPRGEPRDRDVQRRVRRGERLGAGVGVGAEPAAREARGREGLHPARSAAGPRSRTVDPQGGADEARSIRARADSRWCPRRAAIAKPTPTPPEPLGPASKAVTNEIVDAIAEEMNREIDAARDPGRAEAVSHLVQDHRGRRQRRVGEPRPDDQQAQPSLRQPRGARARRQRRPSTTATSSCREADEIDGTSRLNLPLEATPRIARRAAWLVTDGAYKEALIQLRAKLEARKRRRHAARTDVPGVDRREAGRQRRAGARARRSSRSTSSRRARRRSRRVFRDQPALRDSRVARDELPRAPLVPHDRGHERHRHAARERRRDRGERPGRRWPVAAPVLPALRPHREGSAERRRAQGRSRRSSSTSIGALAKAPVDRRTTRAGPVRGRGRGRARARARSRRTSAARRCPRA